MIDSSATYILWPEERWIPESTMWTWYEDAVANKQIAEEYLYAPDIKVVRWALSDAGIITLGYPS